MEHRSCQLYRDLGTRCQRASTSMRRLLGVCRTGHHALHRQSLPVGRRLRWFLMDHVVPHLVCVLRDTADVLCALRRLDDHLEGLAYDALRSQAS